MFSFTGGEDLEIFQIFNVFFCFWPSKIFYNQKTLSCMPLTDLFVKAWRSNHYNQQLQRQDLLLGTNALFHWSQKQSWNHVVRFVWVQPLSRAHTTYVGFSCATPAPSLSFSTQVAPRNFRYKQTGICCSMNSCVVLFSKRCWSTGCNSHPNSLQRLFLNIRLSLRLWSVCVIRKGISCTRGCKPMIPAVFISWYVTQCCRC